MSKQALRPLNRWVHGREPYNAFAFDIDGVLLHGKSPIGGAVEAMKLLLRARPRGGFSGWVLDSTLNSTDVRPLIARPHSLTRALLVRQGSRVSASDVGKREGFEGLREGFH